VYHGCLASGQNGQNQNIQSEVIQQLWPWQYHSEVGLSAWLAQVWVAVAAVPDAHGGQVVVGEVDG